MTQPLSQRLEEMLASVRGRPITVTEKAEVLMLLSEAAQLAKRVEEAPIYEVEPDGCLDLYLGDNFANKRVALVTLEEP